MGAKTKEVGGGRATGLANDTISGLQALLNTGFMGTAGSPNAFGTTEGVFGILADLFSAGGGQAGKNLGEIFSKQQERDVNSLRARFGSSGGAAFGTPAAFAESEYRAEAAPRFGQALTELQLQAMQPILSGAFNLSQMGIAPRQLIQQKSGLGQALGTVAQIGGAALPFINPAFAGGRAGGGGAPMAFGGGNNYLAPGYQFGTGYRPKGFYE